MLITVDRDVSTKFGGFRSIAKQVYADRGLLAFYRGLSPNMVGNAASWGFYFMWYVLNFVKLTKVPHGQGVHVNSSGYNYK